MKIAAKNIRICIFSWKDYDSFAASTGDDRTAAVAVYEAVEKLRKRHGNIPVEYGFCPLTITDNQVIVSAEGIDPSDLPAIQLYATYADGTGAYYWIKKGLADKLNVSWTKDTVLPALSALLYRSKPSQKSIICQVLPIVCDLPVWLWLAVAGFATFEAAAGGKGIRQIAYAAGAGLAWQEFFKRGGFNALKK